MTDHTKSNDRPLILHRCPGCGRIFDSPSVCMVDGTQSEAFVRTIKLALVIDRPPGEPKGVGILGHPGVDADAYIAVDFETGTATVYPIVRHGEGGSYSSGGPPRTDGLNLEIVVEKSREQRP